MLSSHLRAHSQTSPPLLFLALTLSLAACECDSDGPLTDAGPGTDAALDGSSDAGGDGGQCLASQRVCGENCCNAGEACGVDGNCCLVQDLCGNTCCGTGEVCEAALCRVDCQANARCQDSSGGEVCCASGEVCASGQCWAASTSCSDFIDCPAGQYCEPSLGACLPQPGGPECALTPTGGEVQPTLVWHWDGVGAALPDYHHVMMAPMVANLNDDNSDSRVNLDDIPDVVFITFKGSNYTTDGVLRAVRGTDGASVFDVTDPQYRVVGGGQVAIGDIDNDDLVEIVACASASGGLGPLIAFENDGSFKWRSTDPSVVCGQAGPAIADLDGDGNPEVFVKYSVVNGEDGSLAWHRDCVGTGGWASAAHNPCDYTTAADLDGNGRLEVVGGNAAYRSDGTVYYDRTADFLDGYPSIADLNLDGVPEIVVIHSAFTPAPYQGEHFLRILTNTGADLLGPFDINAGMAPADDVAADTVGGGGPATIANFDDDPEPEIATAGAYGYAIFEPNGTLKWFDVTDDRSSRKTGSSVFDFDGDGVAEVVYNDHNWLRVYDGRDGNVRFCQCNTSATLWEYPVIVDVNNDSHAEIILASNNYSSAFQSCQPKSWLGSCEQTRIAAGETQGTHGVRVFASPTQDWVGTRRIWNQHSYHVTNVSETGKIPTTELRNWTSPPLNNFRQNVQPGATNLTDLVPEGLSVDVRSCPSTMEVFFRVVNRGWAAAPAGVPVTVYALEGTSFVPIGRVTTSRALLPGEDQALSASYDISGLSQPATVRFRIVINDPGDTPIPLLECDEENDGEVVGSCDPVVI